MLKIKQSVKTLSLCSTPHRVILQKHSTHCTWSFGSFSDTQSLGQSPECGSTGDPQSLESFLGCSAILSHKYM